MVGSPIRGAFFSHLSPRSATVAARKMNLFLSRAREQAVVTFEVNISDTAPGWPSQKFVAMKMWAGNPACNRLSAGSPREKAAAARIGRPTRPNGLLTQDTSLLSPCFSPRPPPLRHRRGSENELVPEPRA